MINLAERRHTCELTLPILDRRRATTTRWALVAIAIGRAGLGLIELVAPTSGRHPVGIENSGATVITWNAFSDIVQQLKGICPHQPSVAMTSCERHGAVDRDRQRVRHDRHLLPSFSARAPRLFVTAGESDCCGPAAPAAAVLGDPPCLIGGIR